MEAEALSELVEHKFGESPVELILAAPLTQDVVFNALGNAHDLADMNARPNVWVFRRAVNKSVCRVARSSNARSGDRSVGKLEPRSPQEKFGQEGGVSHQEDAQRKRVML